MQYDTYNTVLYSTVQYSRAHGCVVQCSAVSELPAFITENYPLTIGLSFTCVCSISIHSYVKRGHLLKISAPEETSTETRRHQHTLDEIEPEN
jgi:hypothetical protein